jgi:hypothetical protein
MGRYPVASAVRIARRRRSRRSWSRISCTKLVRRGRRARHVIRTWARINGRQELNRLEKRLAYVERDRQRVVMFPQGKGAYKVTKIESLPLVSGACCPSTQRKGYLPADLANEPPHERRSLREVVPYVSRDSVHAEHDSLRTFSLRPHLSR